MLERPITTASSPASDGRTVFAQIARSRAACTAPAPADRSDSRPALTGWKPSTSLAGSIACRAPSANRSATATAAAPGCRAPSGSALSRAISASSSASVVVCRQPVIERAHAAARWSSSSCCRHRLSLAGLLPTSTTARPGRDAAVARQPMHRVGDLAAQVGRNPLAVDDLCTHGRTASVMGRTHPSMPVPAAPGDEHG